MEQDHGIALSADDVVEANVVDVGGVVAEGLVEDGRVEVRRRGGCRAARGWGRLLGERNMRQRPAGDEAGRTRQEAAPAGPTGERV